MERAVALKKLRKLLGDKLGYRVDPKAPDQDDRDEAMSKLSAAATKRNVLRDQVKRRLEAVLQADTKYQRLKKELAEASQYCDDLSSIIHHYRFTVGISGELFFHIKAQGDSWEQVIAKLEKERVR